MRDNMLVNMSGLDGHFMPIDLNIEHIIGQLKVGTISIITTRYLHLLESPGCQRARVNMGPAWRHIGGNRPSQ